MKILIPLCAAGMLLLSSNVTFADEATPEQLAARCASAVNDILDRCTNAARIETEQCVKEIRRLLAAGDEQGAIRVARECVKSAESRTQKCVNRVKRLCAACIEILVDRGESALARRLNRFCEEAVATLRGILERETYAIRKALNGG